MNNRDQAFTLVFKGDIREFKSNPFKTETPFGIPYAIAIGDALEELDALLDHQSDAASSETVSEADGPQTAAPEHIGR